jgi:mycothiol synthase
MGVLKARPYVGIGDLEKMRNLLIEGRRANNGTYYVHVGDLNWWLFYPPLECDLWQYISVWDDPQDPGRLMGWALLSPSWSAYDVYVQPELRGSPEAEVMYLYAEEQLADLARSRNQAKIYRLWVAQGDGIYSDHLLRCGFKNSGENVLYMTRLLDEPISVPVLPEGIEVRPMTGEQDAPARAAAQYAAFDSKIPFERYLQRFLEFMRSPVYDHELDIVAASPDGRIGSFCIVWIDPVNHVGLFEPVGTHPAFRGRGMGKAVMLEGLRQLQARGMQTAIVCTIENNLPAIKLYESVGFTTVDKHLTFERLI